MDLSNLRPADGSKQSDNFRRGRGHGSGNGKTAGKGHKGQKARSGATRPGFEGGQMPLMRRIPKRGFKNIFAKQYTTLNVEELSVFEDGTVIIAEFLKEIGFISKINDGLKILGDGELEIFNAHEPPARLSYPEAAGLRHLAFRVDSVAEAVAELAAKGIACEPVRMDEYSRKPYLFS